jgi:glyoxylase-like metal-dependent hydrolase (beta-lactamase superfamily II)
MKLPGPFQIQRVQEFEWPDRELGFLLTNASQAEFLRTRTAQDERFVNVSAGLLRMSFHSFVVTTPQGTLLVDTCVGNHKDRPIIPEWHQQTFPYIERLAQAGFHPADIDFVCCTHLHGDHVGWNTQLENGRWVPTFPNARYLFAESEYRFWESHHATEPDSEYIRPWQDSVLPVVAAGLVDCVASTHEIMSGIRLHPAPGHTPGNVILELSAEGQSAVMSGDVVHHPVQIERPDWTSAFDYDQAEAEKTRQALLARIADTGTWLMGAHFAGPTALTVESDGESFRYRA